MARNDYTGRAASLTGPARRFGAVSPDDAADLPGGVTRAVFVGGAGALAVVDESGNAATFVSGPSQYHPIQVRRVLSAGTTATGIVALY